MLIWRFDPDSKSDDWVAAVGSVDAAVDEIEHHARARITHRVDRDETIARTYGIGAGFFVGETLYIVGAWDSIGTDTNRPDKPEPHLPEPGDMMRRTAFYRYFHDNRTPNP